METLEERYRGDPEFLEWYKRKLLEPGWAGSLDEAEYRYIRKCLETDGALRRKWGISKKAGRGTKAKNPLTENTIRRIAREGR